MSEPEYQTEHPVRGWLVASANLAIVAEQTREIRELIPADPAHLRARELAELAGNQCVDLAETFLELAKEWQRTSGAIESRDRN